ncbi:MAG: DNA polymerase III subunit beta, partial [Fimbriimonadaceae bacterium]|nr:DNA polymerase III subunit beta [Fimbriimonadaceae bacterium]
PCVGDLAVSTANVGVREKPPVKFECSRKDLVDAINLVAPIASQRSPQQLFQTIRMEANVNGLRMTACDGEIWGDRTILATIDEPGTACVQAKILQELVARLPDGPISMERSPGGQIFVRAGASDWRLMALNTEDFPLPPTIAAASELRLPMNELREAIEGVIYAVASDNARAVLTGVLFNYDGEKLTLVATDTHRLAVLRLGKEGIGSTVNAVVPEKALRAIRNLPIADEEEVMLEFDETRLSVDAGSAKVVSQLLAGTYPAWERVVPAEFTRSWKLDRQEMIENLDRTLILARDSAHRVRFGGTGIQLVMSSRSEEKGEAKEEIPAVMENGEIEIAFNGKYVMDALKAMKSDSVVAQMTEPSRPAMFKPIEGDDRFCVIMPMALT